jgi:hypothetical protein
MITSSSSVISVPTCKPEAFLFSFFDQEMLDFAAVACDTQLSTGGFIFTAQVQNF